jgi:hypothetical protein
MNTVKRNPSDSGWESYARFTSPGVAIGNHIFRIGGIEDSGRTPDAIYLGNDVT